MQKRPSNSFQFLSNLFKLSNLEVLVSVFKFVTLEVLKPALKIFVS